MSGKAFGTFLGLDFREESLVLSYINYSLSGMTLLSSSEFRLRDQNYDIQEIRDYMEQHGKGLKDIFVCIPDKWAMTRFIQVPFAKGKDTIDQLMSFEIERHIPFNIDDVVYDFQIIEEKDRLLEVVFTAVRKQKLEIINSVLDKLAIRPGIMTTASFSSLSVVEMSGIPVNGWQQLMGISKRSVTFGEKGERNIIIFAEKGRLEFALVQDGFCRNIRTFYIDELDIKSTVDDLLLHASEIKTSKGIESFTGCFIAGDQSVMAGITDRIANALTVEISVVDVLEYLSKSFQDIDISGLTHSIGACYIGLGIGSFSINLLPHKRQHRIRRVAPVITQVLIVIIVLLLIGIASSAYYRKKNFINRINEVLKRNEPQVVELERLSKRILLFENEKMQIQKLRDREITLELLAELSSVLPKDAWITSLHYKGFETGSKRGEGAELVISGFADASSALIPLLEDSEYFEKVEFVGPIKKSRDKEGFKLRASIVDPLKEIREEKAGENKTKKE